MPEQLGESVEFQIEVEDRPKSLLLVLDRRAEYNIFPWQDAMRLAIVMELAAKDVATEFSPVAQDITNTQRHQIQFVSHTGLVAMLMAWTDRIRFTSLEAFTLVARDLRQAAQDAHLQQRGTKILYDKDGMIAKIINFKAGTTQLVR